MEKDSHVNLRLESGARQREQSLCLKADRQPPHRPQLTAHSTKAQEAQITLTSKEEGWLTGKQQQLQTERLDSHMASQLEGAPPGVPPAPVRCVR